MRIARCSCFVLICLLLLTPGSMAQLTPPAQDFVLRFNGNQIARAPVVQHLRLTSEFTMEAWVCIESWNPLDFIMGKRNDQAGVDPMVHYDIELSQDGKLQFIQTTGQPGSYRNATAPTPVELKKWTHVAGVLSSGTLHLYVNGTKVATGQSSGPSTTSTMVPFAVGAEGEELTSKSRTW